MLDLLVLDQFVSKALRSSLTSYIRQIVETWPVCTTDLLTAGDWGWAKRRLPIGGAAYLMFEKL